MTKHIKEIVKKIVYLGQQTTAVLDRRFLAQRLKCQWPLIFILGPPRSGTTLLYQLMIHAFKLAYFPNIGNTFYMCPIFATQLGMKRCPVYQTNFTSNYGFEKRCMAPSEAGNIWNRWFPEEKRDGFNYTPASYLTLDTQHLIYQLIANLERLFEAPFLTKNVKTNVRLRVLYEIFPNALFIRIQRDLIDTAVSLLLYRRKKKLNWHSVMPKEINKIKRLSDIEQVCHQIFYVEKNMKKDIQLFAPDQFYSVRYERLCENPIRELEKIHHFLTIHECKPERKNNRVPPAFCRSKPVVGQWINQKEIRTIEKIISKLYESIVS